MYCANCGVRLADTEAVCPLCGTAAFHPDIVRESVAPLYPDRDCPEEKKASKLPHIILTVLYLLPILIVLLCDLQTSGRIVWSGFVVGALLTGYVAALLPLWFKRPNPVIFVPCTFTAMTVYLLYICLATGGHWFLSFAFPVTGGIGLIVTAVVTLLRYVKRGELFILGGAGIALGGFMLLVEFLLNLTFDFPFAGWSLYPLTALVLLGGLLIFLGICRPARQTMERKFFI